MSLLLFLGQGTRMRLSETFHILMASRRTHLRSSSCVSYTWEAFLTLLHRGTLKTIIFDSHSGSPFVPRTRRRRNLLNPQDPENFSIVTHSLSILSWIDHTVSSCRSFEGYTGVIVVYAFGLHATFLPFDTERSSSLNVRFM